MFLCLSLLALLVANHLRVSIKISTLPVNILLAAQFASAEDGKRICFVIQFVKNDLPAALVCQEILF